MNKKIREVFAANLSEELKQIIISNPIKKEGIVKVKIRPVLLKKELKYQAAEYTQTQVFHQNYTKDELLLKAEEWMGQYFKQAEIKTAQAITTMLASKKGTVTVKVKKEKQEVKNTAPMEHNRSKQYLLPEGTPVPFLVDLGIMSVEGKIIQSKYDKFKQINRYLEFIEDVIPAFDKNKSVRILDFGCGKSYLTFAMYYYLREIKGYEAVITGLDLKDEVINYCNQLKERYGYDGLEFLKGNIADYELKGSVDMVVTLHACDTATDYALYNAYRWGAKVILSVPCCQHEMNAKITCDSLSPLLKYGLIKERVAALLTDSLRANILECSGYRVQLLEFIDMSHTPKNILIRAVKREKPLSEKEEQRLRESVQEVTRQLGTDITLSRLMNLPRG